MKYFLKLQTGLRYRIPKNLKKGSVFCWVKDAHMRVLHERLKTEPFFEAFGTISLSNINLAWKSRQLW